MSVEITPVSALLTLEYSTYGTEDSSTIDAHPCAITLTTIFFDLQYDPQGYTFHTSIFTRHITFPKGSMMFPAHPKFNTDSTIFPSDTIGGGYLTDLDPVGNG